jgi:hypothetical protein
MNKEYLEYAFYLYSIDEKRNKFIQIYNLEDMYNKPVFKKYIDKAINKIRQEKIRSILHNA